jgi:peptidoglycan hydrolase CwlO-like protein
MKDEEILNLIRSNPKALVSYIEELEAKKKKLEAKKERLEAKKEKLEAKNRTLLIEKEVLEAENWKLDPISIELRKRILR